MLETDKKPTRLLRLKEVKHRTGLSRSSIYLMISENQFPRQIQLSGNRSVAWVEQEIEEWIQMRIKLSNHT
ncbi:MAG: hypothetical protein COV52_06005 [Gammaproteobacteria bacterium CG11_big_fil_rev_8_21_14_0_20_46_22]|nr:MAG: hypothetical protein COW05_07655 [Gammaproteobacteria bacterium CG12_big_fil_rev_8_21_14_0_65_46_12]PIR11056.1 MAG: hypothetical protein COV52_06005 [Gammaproteobacteria bacterium CG11_big_fil_rev_8_21_14_0_20_46_22]